MTDVQPTPDNNDGAVYYYNGTYAQAREGTSASAIEVSTIPGVGQIENYSPGDLVGQAFIAFDTSALGIPATKVITAVSLQIRGQAGGGLPDSPFVIEARLHDWGATMTSADFVPGSSLGSKTLLATYDVANPPDDWLTSSYMTFTSEDAFLSSINQSGFTRIVLASRNQRLDVAPTGRELGEFYSATEAFPPILTISYDFPTLRGNQAAPSGRLITKQFIALAGVQAAPGGTLSPALAIGDPNRGRTLPISAGTARVTTPRPASGSIRTRRDGVL